MHSYYSCLNIGEWGSERSSSKDCSPWDGRSPALLSTMFIYCPLLLSEMQSCSEFEPVRKSILLCHQKPFTSCWCCCVYVCGFHIISGVFLDPLKVLWTFYSMWSLFFPSFSIPTSSCHSSKTEGDVITFLPSWLSSHVQGMLWEVRKSE